MVKGYWLEEDRNCEMRFEWSPITGYVYYTTS